MGRPLGTNRDPVDNSQFLLAIADRLIEEVHDSRAWDHIRRLQYLALRERWAGSPTTCPPEKWEAP